MIKSIVLIGITISAIVVGINGRATGSEVVYMEGQCSSNQDCNAGECCVLGGNRYSIPQCMPLLESGASCRPRNVQLNTTLVYPDGNQITLTDVYFIFCPCTYGLSCEAKEDATCIDHTQKSGFNHLLEEESTQDD
ncbi:astakine-like [Venturia canescens]|uniref:astakine-like n=1 Tax=Venturia canescens TaxID=32260 RepID=UPI001C9D2486|nr:astakine-like [Venturia canescens]